MLNVPAYAANTTKNYMAVKLYIENVFTRVQANGKEKQAIYDCLAYKVANHEIIRRKTGNYHWDGVKSFFDRRRNVFLTGFVPKVCQFLQRVGVAYEIIDTRKQPNNPRQVLNLKDVTLRGYQDRCLEAYWNARLPNVVQPWGRGVLCAGTGAGKTLMSAAITQMLDVRTLFLTHRVNLLTQSAKRFKEYMPTMADKIGIIGGGMYEPRKFNFATVQTIASLLKRHPAIAKEILEEPELLIIDEAHRSGAKQFWEPACLATNAFYRLNLTATPFMKGNAQDDMYLMGLGGPIFERVTNYELIEGGYLARPLFRFLTVNQPNNISKLRAWRDIYEMGIVNNTHRNNLITKNATSFKEMGKKTLVIVSEVQHGEILLEQMKRGSMRVEFVAGKTAYSSRDRSLRKLAKGKLDTIICTNIFDEGIDVKEVDSVILGAGTKSAPALFQRTGRAVRKKEKDNYALILDFIDRQHPKLFQHSMRRYNLVKNEKGFTIL